MGCGAAIRVEHQLHILKMAFSCAGARFRQHFSSVVVGRSAELAESGKEMVMAGFRARNELAHGERVQ